MFINNGLFLQMTLELNIDQQKRLRELSKDQQAYLEILTLLDVVNDITEKIEFPQLNPELKRNIQHKFSHDQKEHICQFLPDQTIIFANETLCFSIGKNASQIIGEKLNDIFPPHILQQLLTECNSLTPETPTKTITTQIPDGYDNLRWYQWIIRAIFDDNRNPIIYQSVGQDIHDQQLTEIMLNQSLQRYQTIVESQADAVIHCLVDGTITFVNEAYCLASGRTKEEILGTNWIALLSDKEKAKTHARIEHLIKTHETTLYEYPFIQANRQNERWYQWSDTPIVSEKGDVIEIQSVGRDIHDKKLIETQLMESEERFRQMAENVQEVLMIYDIRKSELLYISPVCQQIWGQTPFELYEEPSRFLNIIHPEDIATLQSKIEHSNFFDDPFEYEVRFIRDDSEERWLNLRTFPIRDDQEVTRIAGIGTDVTDRKKLHLQNQFYASLIANIHEAVVSTDLERKITSWNQGAERIFGWKTEEVLGKPIGDVVQSELSEETKVNLYDEIYKTGHIRMEVIQHHKDGRKLTIELNISVLHDEMGNIIGTVGVNKDITAQKLFEDQTHKLNLEQERVNLLQTLIQDIAHDLKNPIATIKTQLYMANRSLDLPEKNTHIYLEKAEVQVDHLVKILEDFLDMSRLDREEMINYLELQYIDIYKLIQKIISEHQLQITKKSQNVRITATDKIIAYVDPTNFNRALSNLIINAINYTPYGGEIHIHTQQTQMHTIIEVHDTGIGIAENELPNIFTRFYRVDKSRTGLYQSGSGLGLSIVQRIVELHGGMVEVESQLNIGSIFRIIIPRKFAD